MTKITYCSPQFEPKGPLVNSEFYSGWLDTWGSKHETRNKSYVLEAYQAALDEGACVNIYMIHGGTNFAFEARNFCTIM